MATNLYPIARSGSLSRPNGLELLATIEQLSDAWQKLQALRTAIIQEKDGAAGNATDYVTPAKTFGFTTVAGAADDGTVALAAFTEIDACTTTAGAAVTQLCGRFKQ